jgi:hypothetical protein
LAFTDSRHVTHYYEMAEVVRDYTPANGQEVVCRLVTGQTLTSKLGPEFSPPRYENSLDFQQEITTIFEPLVFPCPREISGDWNW